MGRWHFALAYFLIYYYYIILLLNFYFTDTFLLFYLISNWLRNWIQTISCRQLSMQEQFWWSKILCPQYLDDVTSLQKTLRHSARNGQFHSNTTKGGFNCSFLKTNASNLKYAVHSTLKILAFNCLKVIGMCKTYSKRSLWYGRLAAGDTFYFIRIPLAKMFINCVKRGIS
jgi:hypothetical protein